MGIDFAHFDGNTYGNVDVRLRRALTEGGGSKVIFGVKSQSFLPLVGLFIVGVCAASPS